MDHDRRRGLMRIVGAATLWPWLAPGRAAASIADETWFDAARRRDVPVRVRRPAGAGPWPLVLYSHGLGGSREGGDAWGEAWRAAGFVVVHLQHPGSDTDVLRGGWPALRAAASAKQLIARAADVGFAIDEVQRRQRGGDPAWAAVRGDAIGLAGHSFGAQTVQAVAGRRFPLGGAALADERVRAFVALSPSIGDGPLSPAQQFGEVVRPFLVVTGSLDGDPFGKYDGGDSRARVHEGLPPGRRALLWLDGADHMTFAGNAERRIDGRGPFGRAAGAREAEPRRHALVAHVTTLWWRAYLGPDAEALAQLRSLDVPGPGDRWAFG